MPVRLRSVLMKFDSLLPEWGRKLVRNREWRNSSGVSAMIFVLNTALIYRLVGALGHGWQLKVGLSLATDVVMYGFNRYWVWGHRSTATTTSAAWSFLWWFGFLLFNSSMAWLLMKQAGIGTLWGQGALGVIGATLNPFVFLFRDRIAFRRVDRMTASA